MQPMFRKTSTYGPFTDVLGRTVFVRYEDGYVQTPPYDIVTSRFLDVLKRTGGEADAGSWSWGPRPFRELLPAMGKAYDMANNRAYETFVAKAKTDAASFGATLTAERKETWAMFVKTVGRVTSGARAAKRGDFEGVSSALGLPFYTRIQKRRVGYVTRKRYNPRMGKVVPTRVPRYTQEFYVRWAGSRWMLKSSASAWLMWSYGVKPLAQDCYNLMETLTTEQASKSVRGRVGRTREVQTERHWAYPETTFTQREGRFGIQCMGEVYISNADLHLLAQSGLLNPVQWLWEAIPFSFVVDWFSNLGSMINAMSELTGLGIRNGCTTVRQELREQVCQGAPYPARNDEKTWFSQQRIPGIITPTLVFAYERTGWQRGLNAISLLIGVLRDVHR